MKIRIYILVFLILALLVNTMEAKEQEDSTPSREYKVKAAFIYNFIKFHLIDWPKDVMDNDKEAMTIGIIGKYPFGNAFESIKGERIRGRKIVIRQFKGFNPPGKNKDKNNKNKSRSPVDTKALRKCHILFVCSSEKKYCKEIIELVKDHSVLTIGETDNFLQAGGIINFVTTKKRVNLEVNTIACKRAKLRISSTVLGIAKRVIKEEKTPKN